MIKLKLKRDTVQLECDYAFKDKCAEVGGGRYSNKTRTWTYPISALLTISEVFKGYKVQAEPEVFEYIKSLKYRDTVLQGIKDKSFELEAHPFLMYHQRQCVAISKYFSKFAYFLDTGTGKTLTALEIINKLATKFLVICPKAIIKSAWVEDQEQFYPHVKLLPLSRNMGKEDYEDLYTKWFNKAPGMLRKDAIFNKLKFGAQVYITNPESFKIDTAKIMELGITGLMIDESTIIKNPNSATTKLITSFADAMDYVYIWSGKPAPNSQLDYFAQMKLIDMHLLGNSFYAYRLKYFHTTDYMGYKWAINEGGDTAIAERIAKKSIFIRKEDCMDLPAKTYLTRLIEMPPAAYKIYRSMEIAQMAVLTDEETVLAVNKVASIMKLRQMSSGFVYNEEDTKPLHSVKLDELETVLNDIGDKQVIVWAQFKEEIRQIEQLFNSMGATFTSAYSGTKHLDESIHAFKHGAVQYMVAHPQTLKFGVTFTNCTYAIYYSKSYSLEEYYQSHDRIYRKGQTQPCTFIDILVDKTVDIDINQAIKSKGGAALVIENMVRRNKW